MSVEADITQWIQRLSDADLPWRPSSPDLRTQLIQSLKRPIDKGIVMLSGPEEGPGWFAQRVEDHRVDFETGLSLLQRLVSAEYTTVDSRMIDRLGGYPVREPSLLVSRLLDRRLKYGRSPVEVGVLWVDALTVIHLGQLSRGQPVTHLPVVIDDHIRKQRFRLEVGVNETVEGVIRQVGIDPAQISHCTQGPALQKRVIDLKRPICHSELWFHVWPCRSPGNVRSCTRCGECVSICPVGLHPAGLLESASNHDSIMAEQFYLQSCIECGLCEAVCPSELPLLEAIRGLKRLTE
ncbi:MAG: hypothetical protein KatS3mg104_1874 [Phycisphaerae bacterium]|jgi:electron transport complex protein RnfC|nr:MAG: hypothetical protein KatS3mg104_1874 [Phycisphaerae bacterium]